MARVATKEQAKKNPIKKRAPRTQKEKLFAKEYIANGGIGYKAALAVYDIKAKDPVATANTIARENLQKLSIVEMMDKVDGLTKKDRLIKLVEGLNATKNISGVGDADSGSLEFVEVPDMPTRYKYLELTFKLDSSLKQAEITNNTQINIQPILGGESAIHPNDGDQPAAEAEEKDQGGSGGD